jgi:SAM-dependent methyltransferase
VSSVLGNPLLRRAATANFSSGKVAFGEKNRYILPIFPLEWIRVDFDGADFDIDLGKRAPLPFADGSQRILYAAHLVEHLSDPGVRHFFAECHRILAPGGAVRIETPDAEQMIALYRQRDAHFLSYFRARRAEELVGKLGYPPKYLEDQLSLVGGLSNYMDHAARSGHIPVYASADEVEDKLATLDLEQFTAWCVSLQSAEQLSTGGHQNWMTADKLRRELLAAGFTRVEHVDFNVTTIPGLLLNRGSRSIREKRERAFYSVYVEAFK